MPNGVAVANPRSWLEYWKQDLKQTPGRLGGTLRITLASVILLVLMMVLQVPYMAYALFVVSMISAGSPAAGLRTGIATLLVVVCVLAVAFAVVILTDNDPVARVLSLAAMTFIAGMIAMSTNVPALGSIWGLIYGVAIGLWENHAPADRLVKTCLWLLAAVALAIGVSLAVVCVFALRSPVQRLADQLRSRYRALAVLFDAHAHESTDQQRQMAAQSVSRLAAEGHRGMLELYQEIDRDLPRDGLPIADQLHIITVAELLDASAAFAFNPDSSGPELRSRCRIIAQQCDQLAKELKSNPESALEATDAKPLTNLDRVESLLRAMQTTTSRAAGAGPDLPPAPSEHLSLLIPGALRKTENVAFALKISLCATLCYILYHAVDWPGISTAVTTVMVAGLVSTGAMKQKLTLRLIGATVGGLVLGIGAEVFLFPFMDSITSLVVVIGAVAFLSAWIVQGPRFSYVGIQIAFAFYLTSLEGFATPTALAPARDRLAGILLAVLVMWFVFDQVWPVRTIAEMRRVVASVLKDVSRLVALIDTRLSHADQTRELDNLRARLAKQLSTVRALNDAAEYEFGADRENHIHAGDKLTQISITAVALAWNHVTLAHEREEGEFLSPPALVRLREAVAQGLSSMADALEQKQSIESRNLAGFDLGPTAARSDSEYAWNTISRYSELQTLAVSLQWPD